MSKVAIAAIDLGKKSFHLHAQDERGHELYAGPCASTRHRACRRRHYRSRHQRLPGNRIGRLQPLVRQQSAQKRRRDYFFGLSLQPRKIDPSPLLFFAVVASLSPQSSSPSNHHWFRSASLRKTRQRHARDGPAGFPESTSRCSGIDPDPQGRRHGKSRGGNR